VNGAAVNVQMGYAQPQAMGQAYTGTPAGQMYTTQAIPVRVNPAGILYIYIPSHDIITITNLLFDGSYSSNWQWCVDRWFI
jgi:hypothetical protein